MMELSLLLAEDDPSVAQVIACVARMAWPECRTTIAANGTEALRRFAAARPDLVVLDVSMPPPDGLAVCQHIRQSSRVPILMLTAHADTLDTIRALDLGADDYLTKPFHPLELLARLRALVRRSQGAAGSPHESLAVGDVVLNLATHVVRVRGEAVELTATEYRLLETLMRRAGAVLSYRYLLERVWGPAYANESHYLRVFVGRLRRKLGDDPDRPRYIQTEWNTGYRFAPAPPAVHGITQALGGA